MLYHMKVNFKMNKYISKDLLTQQTLSCHVEGLMMKLLQKLSGSWNIRLYNFILIGIKAVNWKFIKRSFIHNRRELQNSFKKIIIWTIQFDKFLCSFQNQIIIILGGNINWEFVIYIGIQGNASCTILHSSRQFFFSLSSNRLTNNEHWQTLLLDTGYRV